MTSQTERQTIPFGVAHPSIDRPPHPSRRTALDSGGCVPLSLGSSLGRRYGRIACGLATLPRWLDRRNGLGHAEANPAARDECDSGIGPLCPRLAEARAQHALAERQVVEINHRLGNMLQMIVAMIGRRRRRQDDPEAERELDRLAARVQAAATLHRSLLPPRTRTLVDLGAVLETFAVSFAGVTGLVCEIEADTVIVSGDVAMHLATAVNELAWNAYKHAYRGVEGGVLQILCHREIDGRLRLSVADRGLGLPEGFDPSASEGFGLMVVSATARQFAGELRAESHEGARFTLLVTIPGG